MRETTAEECQSYCDDSCNAVEWWEKGKNACYICTDLERLTPFPKHLKNDQSFPPHVFIKRSSMLELLLLNASVFTPCLSSDYLTSKTQNKSHILFLKYKYGSQESTSS